MTVFGQFIDELNYEYGYGCSILYIQFFFSVTEQYPLGGKSVLTIIKRPLILSIAFLIILLIAKLSMPEHTRYSMNVSSFKLMV